MRSVGHDGRGANQFGLLLAAAELLLQDRLRSPNEDTVKGWADKLSALERYEEDSDHEQLLKFLRSRVPDSSHGSG